MKPTTESLRENILANCSPEPNSGCWLWLLNTATGGYGRITAGRRSQSLVHRVSYEVFKGPIPEGLTIDHLCKVKSCVNPGHLEAVTQRENWLRTTACQTNSERFKLITHCPQGHEYTPENTRMDGDARKCITCLRARDRARRPRKTQ